MANGCGTWKADGWRPSNIAASSSRENQRASSSSVASTVMSLRLRLGEAADHQRGRKGPGLRGQVDDARAGDAGLLADLAPHRVLDRLAGLEKPGQRRIHARREAGLAPDQAALAVDGQHDHDRVDARKMLCVAGRAFAPPAGGGDLAPGPAIGAEAVAVVPVEHGLGAAQLAENVGRQHLAHGERAQVDQLDVAALGESRRKRAIERRGEERPAIRLDAEEDALDDVAEVCRLVAAEQRQAAPRRPS